MALVVCAATNVSSANKDNILQQAKKYKILATTHFTLTWQQSHLFAEVDFLAYVNDGHLLRRGHNDCAVHMRGFQELRY